MNLDLPMFFYPAQERYKIFRRKRGGRPKPWTNDPIFQNNRFCNVHRENDKVTVWLRENYRGLPGVTVAGVATFRFINRIETAEKMLRLGLFHSWDPELARRELSGLKPLVGAAYIIKTPNGFNKLDGVIEIVNPIWEAQRQGTLLRAGRSLEEAFNRLRKFPFLGSFMAYQIIADLQYTPFLVQATDKMTWAAAGPGSAKGLACLLGQPDNFFNYNSSMGQGEMLKWFRELLVASQDVNWWPKEFEPLDMQCVQNWCCETFKYWKAKKGLTLKQRYSGI